MNKGTSHFKSFGHHPVFIRTQGHSFAGKILSCFSVASGKSRNLQSSKTESIGSFDQNEEVLGVPGLADKRSLHNKYQCTQTKNIKNDQSL